MPWRSFYYFSLINSQIAIFQPPYMVTKLEDSPFVYDGPASTDKIKTFVQTQLYAKTLISIIMLYLL